MFEKSERLSMVKIRILMVLLLLAITVCFAGCLSQNNLETKTITTTQAIGSITDNESSPSNAETWNRATAKAELKSLPQKYESAKAVADGCFVILHGRLLSDPKMADNFTAAARAGKAASLRIVQYTIEGDPIITQVDFLDGIFHGLLDESRDNFGRFGSEIVEYEMPYLAVFDDGERQVAYLVKEDGLSLEAINTIINQDQSSDGPKDLVFLYLYNHG
jgi:hypothetical protein